MQLLLVLLLPVGIVCDINDIDEIIKKLLDCRKETASLGVSIVQDDSTVFNKAYGKADREADIDATLETRYSIGSVTKIFTSYLAGLHVQKGSFQWEDELVDIFKKHGLQFSLQGKFRSSEATINDALAHRTGIKAYEVLLSDGRNLTRADWMLDVVPLLGEVHPIRDTFYYNNWMYTLIGYIMEIADKSSYEDQVKKEIFDKVGMDNTFFVSDGKMDKLMGDEIAIPYSEDANNQLYRIPLAVLKLIGPHDPAGGMMSTTTDMSNFIKAVLNAINKKSSPLDAEIIDWIWTPLMMVPDNYGPTYDLSRPTFPVSFTQKGYGAGTFTGYYRGFRIYFHGGSSHGHYSYFTFMPEKNIGIFTVLSGNDYQLKDCFIIQQVIWMAAVDLILDVDPWLTTETACKFPSLWSDVSKVFQPSYTEKKGPVENSQRFVGVWKRPEFPDVIINGTDDNFYFKMGAYNGSIFPVADENLQLYAIVSQPIDPINWPDSQKSRAHMTFKIKDDKITEMELLMFTESYTFTRSNHPATTKTFFILPLLLFCFL